MDHAIWANDHSPELTSNSGRDSTEAQGFNWRSSGPHSFTFGSTIPNTHRSTVPSTLHDAPPPSPPMTGALGGIFGMIQNALGGPAQQNATTSNGSGTRSYNWQSPSGNAHFSMTTSTTTFPRGGAGRPMTPDMPVPNLNQSENIPVPLLYFANDHDSFLNDMFSVPISPGGTPGIGFGPPRAGPGGAADPITLLDILLGGRFGSPGQYAHSQEEFDRIISDIMERTQTGTGPPAATEDTIASLPKKKADKAMLGESGKAECTICMAEVTTGEVVTELYCKHWFHTDCIKAWLEQHNTCPHCRKSVEEAKEEFEKSQKEAGSPDRSRGGDRQSERKRVRRSRSSNQSNSRSGSTSRDLPRVPGAFPTYSNPPLPGLRMPSFTSREAPRSSGVNPRNVSSPFRTSTPPVSFTNTFRPSPPNQNAESDTQVTSQRTRLRDSLLARRPSSPTHPTEPPISPPRRSRSGDPRTLYASRNDHINETARRSSRLNAINAAGGRDTVSSRDATYDNRDYEPRRRRSSHGADVPRRQHTTQDEREPVPEPEENPGLIARARGWLGGR
jgi:hypothetical protein